MNVEKSVHKINDPDAIAIEAWVYVPRSGYSVLVTSKDKTPVAPIATKLYETVRIQMEHPRIGKDALYAIDAFMKDDLDDDKFDDGDDIPF